MNDNKIHIVLCNNAVLPTSTNKNEEVLVLDYQNKANVNIKLPDFVNSVYHISDRVKDLLEISSYIFAADRNTKRGERDDIEFQKWARKFHFHIKVRDFDFWNNQQIKESLNNALKFVSGDNDFKFDFQSGYQTPPTSLFDSEKFSLDKEIDKNVVLFSGGLDSLTGIIETLETTNQNLCLVSHRSGQPGTKKTQDALFQALNRDYNQRCKHYAFSCNLKGIRAIEETQRTRSFLYSSIAFAICTALGLDHFYVYENGITSLNFSKRQDLINARASRTTHPKTLSLFSNFFSFFQKKQFTILHPYLFNTKTDILSKLKEFGKEFYIDSTVSCSKTFKKEFDLSFSIQTQQATHCGGCSQCIDRRLASFASSTNTFDATYLYKMDFIKQKVENEVKTTLIDYIRQALRYYHQNIDDFYVETLDYLIDIVDYIEGESEEEKVERIHQLFITHGKQIELALKNIGSPFEQIIEGSLPSIIADREYLKQNSELLAEKVSNELKKALPLMFHSGNLPKDEKDLNNKINSIIERDRNDYEREYPAIRFGLANVVPDHSIYDLLIETKYLRNGTSPSKASDGLAADMFKLPDDVYKLLIVYDPNRSISDDVAFIKPFELKSKKCKVCIIR
jgi:7-cyano-7-deazaguanine synthase in queuosine biosynthesis